jgi:hypothetical protein
MVKRPPVSMTASRFTANRPAFALNWPRSR